MSIIRLAILIALLIMSSFSIGILLPTLPGAVLAVSIGICAGLYSEDFLKGKL